MQGSGVIAVLAVLAVTTALGVWWRRRSGSVRRAGPPGAGPGPVPGLLGLATTVPARGLLLQFSSPVCAPCRQTARALAGVAAGAPGVEHVEIDATEHLDLVRRLGILRTPTVLAVASDGRVVGRSSGGTDPVQAAELVRLLP